jgi:tRNA(Ile)-lysidine synthase
VRRHPFLTRVVPRLTALADMVAADVTVSAGDGILVALSGGPDSTALLLTAQVWRETTGRPVAAAHLDHQLRGADATADADFCRDLCAQLDIPLHTRTADPRPLATRRGRGVEEAARETRRAYFDDILAVDRRLACVATGHHRDDQSETVLLRLLRGCGLDGLRGIAPRSGRVIHPLLAESRADILTFLGDQGQAWRQDQSNGADDAARNRVRRELLPALRDIFGPGAVDGLPRLADLAAADLDLLDNVTAEALAGAAAPDGSLRISRLRNLNPALARRVLRRWLADAAGLREDLAFVHVEAVRAWLERGQSGQGLDLPHGVRLRRDFDHLLAAAPVMPSTVPCGLAAEFRVTVTPMTEAPVVPAGVPADADAGRLICPAEVLQGNLRVANWQEGDTMEPLGLGGRKKLSDLFRERRIPAPNRASLLLVADAAGILWVPGVAQAERTRVLPTTRRAVTILLQRRLADAGEIPR